MLGLNVLCLKVLHAPFHGANTGTDTNTNTGTGTDTDTNY